MSIWLLWKCSSHSYKYGEPLHLFIHTVNKSLRCHSSICRVTLCVSAICCSVSLMTLLDHMTPLSLSQTERRQNYRVQSILDKYHDQTGLHNWCFQNAQKAVKWNSTEDSSFHFLGGQNISNPPILQHFEGNIITLISQRSSLLQEFWRAAPTLWTQRTRPIFTKTNTFYRSAFTEDIFIHGSLYAYVHDIKTVIIKQEKRDSTSREICGVPD